jgi:hypothetical protein
VTPELVDAVAKETAAGRLLLVATTNLDREETTIWTLGAIASQKDADGSRTTAVKLMQNVLIASASVPGVFPPVMIDVQKDGRKFQEMHVDGGASTPFFVAPDIAIILGYAPESLRGANIYVIVNGQASSAARSTPNNAVDIAARSFNVVLNHMTRTALAQTDAFAKRNEMKFVFTTIPSSVAFGGSLAFDQANMRAIFDYAMRCATRSQAWISPEQALMHAEAAEGAEILPADTASCPLLPGLQWACPLHRFGRYPRCEPNPRLED